MKISLLDPLARAPQSTDIAPLVADGETMRSTYAAIARSVEAAAIALPLDSLISLWDLSQSNGRYIEPLLGDLTIDMDLAPANSYQPTTLGMKVKNGVIPTPFVENARSFMMLYRTGKEEVGGKFLISAGASEYSGILTDTANPAWDQWIGYGGDLAPLLHNPINGAGAFMLSLGGGWNILYVEMDQAYTTRFGLGGSPTINHARMKELEVALFAIGGATMNAAARNSMARWMRIWARKRQIYLHAADCPNKVDRFLFFGDSTMEGRAKVYDPGDANAVFPNVLPPAERDALIASTFIASAVPTPNAILPMFNPFKLGANHQQFQPDKLFNPVYGLAKRRQSFSRIRGPIYVTHAAYGGSFTAQAGTIRNDLDQVVDADKTWNAASPVESGLLYSMIRILAHGNFSMLSQGIGFDSLMTVLSVGLNDMTRLSLSRDFPTVVSRYQAIYDVLVSCMTNIPVSQRLIRPHLFDPAQNPEAANFTRGGQNIYASNNPLVQHCDIDAYVNAGGLGLEPDMVHFDAGLNITVGEIGHDGQ